MNVAAPVTVIVAWDTAFYEQLSRLNPHGKFRDIFASSAALAQETAFRNSSLQGGYLILAARALGLTYNGLRSKMKRHGIAYHRQGAGG